jgi:hypothetical protein
VQGSIKNNIVATELLEERSVCNFDQEELYKIYWSNPEVREIKNKADFDAANDPIMMNTHEYYEWTPKEIQENWMKKLKRAWQLDRKFYFQMRPHAQVQWMSSH